jgi:alkylhydroperoxidase/carboxymuconolactone decarboxylase family protein YurZ
MNDWIAGVTQSDGHLARQVRQDLVAAKTMSGALGSFAIKVAQNAASINDEHIQALIRAGHSEDAIFECILAAALGAGMERLRAGLAALEGSGDVAD